ncbi:MAG: hypothetical protein ABIH76_00815 [Candidatus Bathyarchaeota archaeon]
MMIKKAVVEPGIYYYLLPTFTQAKKIIWDGMTIDGKKFLDYIPKEITKSVNASELKIEIKANGGSSIIQLIGTDHYDSIRGTNPRGCVFSEYAYQNPNAWDVISPILKVNKGWAVFNSTPNGKNDFYDLYNFAQENKDWFCELLTIDDTSVLNREDMDAERAEGKSEEMIMQEYFCSFDIGTLGSYYADYVNKARSEGRICAVPVNPNIPVDLFLDLGRNDATSIIFMQTVGKELHVVDFYEYSGVGVEHYLKVLDDYGYRYGTTYLPHDATHKRLESNKTIEDQFREGGLRTEIVEKHEINNGVQEVRRIFPRIWFDKERCFQLVRALENYHKEWDEKAKVFKNHPKHDWSSHAADAMRYLAMGFREPRVKKEAVDTVWNRFAAV